MPPPPVHDLCRWHCRAGDTLFGDSPTLYDPRQTGVLDTSLIHAHEQMHVDLINNTVFGYVLRRLRELEIVPQPLKNRRDRLFSSLSGKIWTCAEGSATATEANIVKSPRASTTAAALQASLTPEYREALAVFQPVCDYVVPFPEPLGLLARGCLIHAVSECAADRAIFRLVTPPQDFWQLAEFLDQGTVPDELLASLVQAAAQIPIAPIAFLFDRNKQLMIDGQLGPFVRNVTFGLKLTLLMEPGMSEIPPLLDDQQRIAYIAAVDAALTQSTPELEKFNWKPDHVSLGSEVRVETQEPPFLLQDEELEPTALLDRMFQLSAAPGFQRFVVLFFLEPGAATYSLIVHPMVLTEQGLDMGVPYLISKRVSPPVLKVIDGSPLPLVWETRILQGRGTVFYSRDLISVLRQSVYLELPEFSWPLAAEIAAALPDQRELVSYQLPPEIGLTVSAVHKGKITIFGFTPVKFLPSFDLQEKASEMALGENHEMASVAVVLLRQSKHQTI